MSGKKETRNLVLPKSEINKDQEEEKISIDVHHELEGEVKEPKSKQVSVPKNAFEKYKLKPIAIGSSDIVFLNAQDPSYYYRTLKNPLLTLWILTNSAKISYATKRMIETGWSMNIQVTPMITHKFDLVATSEGLDSIFYDGKEVDLPNAVFPRLGAVVDYFGLAVVRQLERMDTFVMNGNLSLEISRDKLYTLQTLAEAGVPIPKTMMAKFPVDIETVSREFSFPMILKKSSGSQGKGVMLVPNATTLGDLADMLDTSNPLIFQEFISKSSGRDIRVIVVGGRPVGGMMRVANTGFKANFHQGGYVKPIKLTPAVEWLAIESARLLGLDVAGVDILIDNNTYKICEINASPGYQGFELATGIDVPKKILDFALLRCNVWRKHTKKRTVTTIPVLADHLEPNLPPKSLEEKENKESKSTKQEKSNAESEKKAQ